MIWGCLSYYGVGPIYHISGFLDQFEYIKILYVEEERPVKRVFQRDNNPKHARKSLDLNPIENITNSVSEPKPRNAQDLWDVYDIRTGEE